MLAAAPVGGRPLRGHGVHGRHDDLRRLARVRRAAEPDHEGEPVPASRQRLLPALLRAGRHRQLSRRRLAAARQARRPAHRSRGDGRHRRERRGRALPPGQPPRRGADPDRARRGFRERAGRAAPSAVIERLRNGESLGLALVHEDVRSRRAPAAARPLRQRRAGRRSRPPLSATTRPGRTRRRSWPSRPSTKCSRRWRRSGSARRRSARSRSCRSSRCSIVHGINHEVPLFLASFAGFLAALPAICAHSEDARASRCARRRRSTPSTTSCSRCFCRSRC